MHNSYKHLTKKHRKYWIVDISILHKKILNYGDLEEKQE